MSFGKYMSDDIDTVPADYLLWLLPRLEKKGEDKRTIDEELILEYIKENEELITIQHEAEKELRKMNNGKN